MVKSKKNIVLLVALGLLGLVAARALLAPSIRAQDSPAPGAQAPGEKRWQAVAPGRVEPWSGEIKISAPNVGRITEVLVKPSDTVFAGELLIRLDVDEAKARLASMEAQIAMRKRARNDQSVSTRATDRRKAEDAVFDAEKAVVDARSALDAAAAAKRAGNGSDTGLETARAALTRSQNRLRQDRAELRRLEGDTAVPLPSATEGQLNIARAEWMASEVAIEKMMIRAPTAATVLQVNARAGELANPATAQPLLLIGDVSSLRVRAEVDERDFGDIKIGQTVQVRSDALRGREFAGKVSAIAPFVDSGRNNLRGQRNMTDVNVVEVMVDVAEPGALTVGMKVDVYFRGDSPPGK